ncbi:MAG TPA: GMP synthase [Hanamia sp.]|nr:GMP synthase [Hanamia sp.]
MNEKQFRIAILDMYEGAPNQGMRGLRQIIHEFGRTNNLRITLNEFDVRLKNEIPDLSYDAYISSGGPGSPLESEGTEWEKKYFEWIDAIEQWNDDAEQLNKKHVFFICHSFQLVCRYWKLANVCKRKSTSFGVFPIHLLEDGKHEPVFEGMSDPFYAVDSRDYQVIEPRMTILHKGAKILCIEKDRPHVPYERAIMALRFNDYFIGTQFHPEADAIGMTMYLQTEEKKKTVIENHGEAKWKSMIDQLNDPDKILWTYAHILPNFLNIALNRLQPVLV